MITLLKSFSAAVLLTIIVYTFHQHDPDLSHYVFLVAYATVVFQAIQIVPRNDDK